MKSRIVFLGSVILVCAALSGCVQYPSEKPIEEGVIYAVQYEISEGRTEGFTRVNDPKAVPGGNGKSNIDAQGKLYRDFLLVRFADNPDLDYQAIPVQRLYFVQFGDGGIKQVNGPSESQ